LTKLHRPKYRLAELLGEPGGKTVAEAVKAAENGLMALSGNCLDFVDLALKRIDDAYAALPAVREEGAMTQLYRVADELIGVAATAGLTTMDRAAYSLCDLIDRMSGVGAWDREPIRVHVDALHFFRRFELAGDQAEIREVLQGLRRVCEKFCADNPPPSEQAAPANGPSPAN